MEKALSVEEALRAAIAREVEAFNLYNDAAQGVQDQHQRNALLEMAAQENGHRVKLENILTGNVRWAVRASRAQPVTDLRLTDHLVGGSIEPGGSGRGAGGTGRSRLQLLQHPPSGFGRAQEPLQRPTSPLGQGGFQTTSTFGSGDRAVAALGCSPRGTADGRLGTRALALLPGTAGLSGRGGDRGHCRGSAETRSGRISGGVGSCS